MKKFYSLIALTFACLAANAQTINFVHDGKIIESGSTFTYNGMELKDYGSILEVNIDPDLYILSDKTVTVNATANCTTGQSIQLCPSGTCIPGVNVVSENINLTANTPLSARFEHIGYYMSKDEIPDIISTNLAIYEGPVTGTPVTEITVVMKPKEASVSIVETDPEFKYINGFIEYSVDSASKVQIFDLNGKVIFESEINGKGSINVESFAQGIYVYRLGTKSGKIYIK